MTAPFLSTLATTLAAGVVGAMLFFSTTVAPVVFSRLPADTAGPFIRALFPHYYLGLGAASALALGLALGSQTWSNLSLVLLALVVLGFVVARQWLMPRINLLRDQSLGGERKAAQRFRALHLASVVLNGLQMLGLLAICLGGTAL